MKFHKENFKKTRKEKKISLEQTAKLLGKSLRTVFSWEKGEIIPSESYIRHIAQVLGIGVQEISDLEEINPEVSPYCKQLGSIEEIQKKIKGNLTIEDKRWISKIIRENNIRNKENGLLKTSLSKFSSLMNFLGLLLYTKDKSLKFTYANPAFSLFTNAGAAEIIGKTTSYLFGSKESDALSKLEQEVIHGRKITNFEILIPGTQGREIGLFSGTPLLDENRDIIGIMVSIENITEKVEAENMWKVMEYVINQLSPSLWVMAHKPLPHDIFISDSVFNIFGRMPEEFYKDNNLWFNVVHPEDKKKIEEWVAPGDKGIYEKEYRVIHKDGSVRWVYTTRQTKKYSDRLIIDFGLVTDITEEKLEKK